MRRNQKYKVVLPKFTLYKGVSGNPFQSHSLDCESPEMAQQGPGGITGKRAVNPTIINLFQ
jgi:hypothetical protein